MRFYLIRYHYNFNNPKDSTPLGDGIIKLRDIELQAEPHIIKAIKLVSPKDGSPAGEVNISIINISIIIVFKIFIG